MKILMVALGGALGSVARYGMTLLPLYTDFPLWTFMTNVIGAILIGVIVEIFGEAHTTSPYMTLFWKMGVCGGFTTFSTFSLESWKLLEKGAYVIALGYILGSLIFCIIGIVIGKQIAIVLR